MHPVASKHIVSLNVVAIDAMGGDAAPSVTVAGVAMASIRHPSIHFLLYGKPELLEPLLAKYPKLAGKFTLCPANGVIGSHDKPSEAMRRGRDSSMRLAIDAVARGEAGSIVSAGNTGALMAMAKLVLKTLPGIDRPAIASFMPTLRGESVMLDMGANVDCDAANLVQFALMGAIFARVALGVTEPTIGLLNVGSEEQKGRDSIRQAATALRSLKLPGHYHGFIEGNDIPYGTVDVVVCDGFTGNVALKTAEGVSKLWAKWLKMAFTGSLLARLGALLAMGQLKKLKHRTDPRRYNGAMFLGLNGICVKSHGGTDALGFANAIDVAIDLAVNGFNDKIRAEMAALDAEPSGEMLAEVVGVA